VKRTALGILIAATTTFGSTAFAQQPVPPSYQPAQAPGSIPEPPPPPDAQAASPEYYGQAASPGYYPAAPAVAATPSGQWVYTNQYGWVWMPYGADYTYVTPSNVAYTYAYYPRFGWRWVSSPWVVGVGPTPFWGRPGPVHFAWYGHPRFHGYAPGSRWYYRRPAYQAPVMQVGWHGRGWGHHGGRRW
jgi:hypothetical protein